MLIIAIILGWWLVSVNLSYKNYQIQVEKERKDTMEALNKYQESIQTLSASIVKKRTDMEQEYATKINQITDELNSTRLTNQRLSEQSDAIQAYLESNPSQSSATEIAKTYREFYEELRSFAQETASKADLATAEAQYQHDQCQMMVDTYNAGLKDIQNSK